MSDRRDRWIAGVETKLVSALAAAAAGTPHEWDPPTGLPDGADLVPDITVPPEPMRPGYPPLPWSDITFEEFRRYAQVQLMAEYALAVEVALTAQFERDFGFPVVSDSFLTPQQAWQEAEREYERHMVRGAGKDADAAWVDGDAGKAGDRAQGDKGQVRTTDLHAYRRT